MRQDPGNAARVANATGATRAECCLLAARAAPLTAWVAPMVAQAAPMVAEAAPLAAWAAPVSAWAALTAPLVAGAAPLAVWPALVAWAAPLVAWVALAAIPGSCLCMAICPPQDFRPPYLINPQTVTNFRQRWWELTDWNHHWPPPVIGSHTKQNEFPRAKDYSYRQ